LLDLPQGERKLVAIVFTDMVGCTTLAQKDKALALELLEEQRRIVRPFLKRYNGTEVKIIGDAFLVQFRSAFESAVRLQHPEIPPRAQPETSSRVDGHMVGVHVGNVVEEGRRHPRRRD
jgi:adenylate cyclase